MNKNNYNFSESNAKVLDKTFYLLIEFHGYFLRLKYINSKKQ